MLKFLGSAMRSVQATLLLCLISGFLILAALKLGNSSEGALPMQGKPSLERTERGKLPDTVVVSKTGSSHAVPLTGFNANWLAFPVDDQRLLDTLRPFDLDLIRYPGGGVSDYWDWRKGGLELEKLPPKREPWRTVYEHDPKGLYQLKSVLESTGAEPVFVLNTLTATLSEQRAMLNAAAEKGISVKYIEMGNEYFFDEDAHLQEFPSAEDYAVRMAEWTETLKDDFPSAKISAVGAFSYRGHSDRRRNWNAEVGEHFGNRDAVSFHPYMLLNEEYSTYQEEIDSRTRLPEETMRRARNLGYDDYSSAERFWITEYNTLGKARYRPNLRNTWMHGLLVAAQSLLLMQEERIEMLLPHQITGQETLFRAVETPQWGGSYAVTTYGESIRHLFTVMDGHSTVHPLGFERTKLSTKEGGDQAERIIGNVFDDSTATFVNLSASSRLLRLDSLFGKQSLSYRSISLDDPLKKGVDGDDLERERGTSTRSVSVPPFSMASVFTGPPPDVR
jgi:hypothetical protein